MKPDPYVDAKGRRMMSAAMYRKLSGVVADWKHEEEGKARAARYAGETFVVLLGLTAAVAVWAPKFIAHVLLGGFVTWIAATAIATWVFLRRPPRNRH